VRVEDLALAVADEEGDEEEFDDEFNDGRL